ncbi:unnamed protein product [Phytomonas sp. EM1]|nr:unnamed protein product [Phytomonas sp. EM1]|eukprot:CCW63013.1 unnamed protein product [Phytomonas sp. isolate EM1]
MDVLHAAENPQRENVEGIAEFMLRRLPMTECFLLILAYLVEELLEFARRRYPPQGSLQAFSPAPHVGFDSDEKAADPPLKRMRPDERATAAAGSDEALIEGGSRDNIGGSLESAEVREKYQEANFFLEAAGTVLFITAMLFARHRDREARFPDLCAVVHPSNTPQASAAEQQEGLLCQRAFDYYVLRMVQAFARASEAMRRDAKHSFPVFGYVADTLQVWLVDRCFPSEDARKKAESILGRMSAISEGSVDKASSHV